MKNKIESVLPQEFDELMEVWESAVLATHHFLKKEDFEEIKSAIKNEYFPMVDLYGLKDENNKILGFAGIQADKLEMLFVHAEVRGKGVGKALLRYAIDVKAITQVDVNEQNEQAVGFYEKQGFKIIKRNETDGQGKPYPILEMSL